MGKRQAKGRFGDNATPNSLRLSRFTTMVKAYDDNRKLWGRFYADRLEVGTDRTKLSHNMGGGWKK